MRRMIHAMPPEAAKVFVADFHACLRADEDEWPAIGVRLLDSYPGLRAVFGPDFAAALEAMHAVNTDAALASRDLHIDASLGGFSISRYSFPWSSATWQSAAWRRLWPSRSWRPLLHSSLRAAGWSRRAISEDLLDHKAKTGSVRHKTVADSRAHLKKFAAFIGVMMREVTRMT